MRPALYVAVVLALAVYLCPVQAVHADDVDIITSFSDFQRQEFQHDDAEPFKGYVNLTVTNTGDEPWGDFHFEIFQIGDPIDNVDFIVTSPYEPTSSQTLDGWDVDNATVGATLDLYFYHDWVYPDDEATFTIYTDNQMDEVPYFGLALWPTPVPEPASLLLLALGGLMLRRSRK